jgi:hypothetical protein
MAHPNSHDLLKTVLQLLTTHRTSSLAEGLRLLLDEAPPPASRPEVPEDGIDTAKPTREFLEANVIECGGERNRRKE